jgi:ABC-2 type transport system permease protein
MKLNLIRGAILNGFIIKEFKQILRDRRMRIMVFIAPVIMLLIFGYAVNMDITTIKVAFLDMDKSSNSRDLMGRFTASGYFINYVTIDSPGMADKYLDNGEVDLYMHIPRGFSVNLISGKSTEVQIILDGTDSSRASVIMAYINQISADYSAEFLARKIQITLLGRGSAGAGFGNGVNLQERIMFNPDLTSRNFYLPGVLALIVALIIIMLTSMSVVKEKESGTIEQIIVSPLRPAEFVAGKTIPFAIIGLVDISIITIVAIAWFNVPFNGSFLFLIVGSIFYILCTLSVGLYISTVSQTQQQAMLSTFLFFIPAILFSGFVFPIRAMPEAFQYITYLNPMRYFMIIIRGVFLKGVGFTELWHELFSLTMLGSVLLYLSIRRFNRRFE